MSRRSSTAADHGPASAGATTPEAAPGAASPATSPASPPGLAPAPPPPQPPPPTPTPPLRIMLFTAVPRNLRGGVATIYTRLNLALAARGHTTVELWGAQPGQAPAADELPLAEIHTRWGIPTPASALASARFILNLAGRLRRERPQIVNIHFIHARMAQVFLSLRPIFGYKLVLSAHGSDLFDPPPGNDRWLPRILPRADAIVAVTEPLAARIRAVPGVDPARVHIIPGGIDTAFWRPPTPVSDASTTIDPAPPHPLVVTVGQLRRVKGHDILLDAWIRVRAALPDAQLVIVGDGDRRGELEDQAHRLGIADAITFPGQLPPDQVRTLLHRARAFVLPSRSEALPLALLEAMASGTPVVATAVGGIPELLAGDAGATVPPENPEALATQIIALLRDPTVSCSIAAAAQQRAAGYDAIATAAAYQRLFVRLVTAAPPRRRVS